MSTSAQEAKENDVKDFGSTNMSLELRPATEIFLVKKNGEILRFNAADLNPSIHLITPLEVRGVIRLASHDADSELADYHCEITPHFTNEFSASQFPRSISNDLQEHVDFMADRIARTFKIQPDKSLWKGQITTKFEEKGLTLKFVLW